MTSTLPATGARRFAAVFPDVWHAYEGPGAACAGREPIMLAVGGRGVIEANVTEGEER